MTWSDYEVTLVREDGTPRIVIARGISVGDVKFCTFNKTKRGPAIAKGNEVLVSITKRS